MEGNGIKISFQVQRASIPEFANFIANGSLCKVARLGGAATATGDIGK